MFIEVTITSPVSSLFSHCGVRKLWLNCLMSYRTRNLILCNSSALPQTRRNHRFSCRFHAMSVFLFGNADPARRYLLADNSNNASVFPCHFSSLTLESKGSVARDHVRKNF